MFFPHQANASFLPKMSQQFANWVSEITQIAANFVLKRSTRDNIILVFGKNNEIELTAENQKIFISKLHPNRRRSRGDIRFFDGTDSSKCSFLRAIEFQIINTKLFSSAQDSRS